nr:(Fe-S)-binding protein [Tessaracoccus sp. OH4464_COT-324]
MTSVAQPGVGVQVALFATCIADTMKPSVPIATVKLLERLGCKVVFPKRQTCCGQIMANTGYYKETVPTIKNYVKSFENYDYVVAPSGSCVGSVRHQHEMIARKMGDSVLADEAANAASRTYDIAEFLVDVLGVVDVGAYFPHKVTYHPSCHGKRITKLGDRPYQLLRAVEGLELLELPNADQCCGFGGTFSIKNSDMSVAMAEDKANCAIDSGAEYLTGGDHACLMNVQGILHRNKSNVQTIHLVEILASTKEDPR